MLFLALTLLSCHRKSTVDAGAPPTDQPPDASSRVIVTLEAIDARIVLDAGASSADGSIADAGAAAHDAGSTEPTDDAGAAEVIAAGDSDTWLPWDGGAAGPNGVTDYVTVHVGRSLPIIFSGPSSGVLCDDVAIAEVKSAEASYEVLGKAPGVTHCKFRSMTVLGRYFEITVKP
jgi:hypothetical protein